MNEEMIMVLKTKKNRFFANSKFEIRSRLALRASGAKKRKYLTTIST